MGGDALIMYRPDFDVNRLSGRDRRLFYEWSQLERAFGQGGKIRFEVAECNSRGLPVKYRVAYHIRSIQGVERVEALDMPGVSNPPIFASLFLMTITLPDNYPCVDAPVEVRMHRVMERDNARPEQVLARIRAQRRIYGSLEDMPAGTGFHILENTGSPALLRRKVDEFIDLNYRK